MNKFKKHSVFIILIIISTILLFALFNATDEKYLAIHMIDVGQGDSILIVTPNGKTILIDAGEANRGPTVVSYLKKQKIRTIDKLIATHPHSDHIGGIPLIMDNFHINNFYMPPVAHTTKTFENMLNTARKHGIKATPLPIGTVINFDEHINLFFLSPFKDYGDHLNNWSIVLKLDYLHKSFLFTGDLEYEGEMDLISSYDPRFLRSHLLKVGHHGSNSSSSNKFLGIIQPRIALISCGLKNSYNHPHREVIDRLNSIGAHIYRTDLQGSVVIKSNGKDIWSNTKPYTYRD